MGRRPIRRFPVRRKNKGEYEYAGCSIRDFEGPSEWDHHVSIPEWVLVRIELMDIPLSERLMVPGFNLDKRRE